MWTGMYVYVKIADIIKNGKTILPIDKKIYYNRVRKEMKSF